jgi:hypothetical protein
MNDATLSAFRQVAADMGINPWPEAASNDTMYRVEFQGRGGSWGSTRVLASSPAEAEAKVNQADFSHEFEPMARATHVMNDAGAMVRIGGAA